MDKDVNKLVKQARKNDRSFRDLRSQFMPLMQDIIKQYMRFGDRNDLESAADEGLIYAVKQYQGDGKKLGKRPKSFAAYLYQVVTTYVKRGMLKGRLFSLPEIPYDVYSRMSTSDRELLPTDSLHKNLAKKYNTTSKVIYNVKKLSMSLLVYDIDYVLESPFDDNFEDKTHDAIKHQAVNQLLTLLPNPHREIVSLRFGINGKPAMTWIAIGDAMGLTTRMVKRHYEAGMRFLRIKENKDLLKKFF